MSHRLAILTLSVALCACQSANNDSSAQPAVPNSAGSKQYHQLRHDGRIYVLGTDASHSSFQQNHHMTYTRTLIGEGPFGETVVLEVDPDSDELANWLEAEFRTRNPKVDDYFETVHQGRIYVMANQETLDSFVSNHHMTYTRTLIGEGPDGETVVLEVDPDNDAVADRLEQLFRTKHGRQ